MKRLFLVLGTSILVLPWLSGARVQADLININWGTTASVETANQAGFVPALNPGYYTNAPAYIEMGGASDFHTNSGRAPLAYLTAYDNSSNLSGQVYDFGGTSAQYQLSLSLRDEASWALGTFTFRGDLSGQLPQQGSVSDLLSNTFIGPTTQTLKLGSNLYTVTIGPVVLPKDTESPVSATSGEIDAYISVQHLGPASPTPEPSSLILACLGLPSLGLVGWFRRRRKTVDGNASKS